MTTTRRHKLACDNRYHETSALNTGLRLDRGMRVHVTTTNGGACDYIVAQSWAGPSYSLLVEHRNGGHTSWIDSERLATVEHLDCGRVWHCQ